MGETNYSAGMLVRHPLKPEWGKGRIVKVEGKKVTVAFRDDHAECRKLSTANQALEILPEEPDPLLDNLPTFKTDGFGLKSKKVLIADAIARFQSFFPGGFDDPAYLGKGKLGSGECGERNYKWEAHERYAKLLGGGHGEALLKLGKIEKATQLVGSVVSQNLNLLSPFENMALHDGLAADPGAAQNFLAATFDFIDAAVPREDRFHSMVDALRKLPVEEGKARVATWPVVTILPYLARPDVFMFLKPDSTQKCAARLPFELHYTPDLEWITYKKLMTMSTFLLEQLKPLGARDYIDVQSFIWVVATY